MAGLIAPDPGPLQRLQAVVADPQTMAVIVQRVTDGETLKAIVKAWQVPYGRLAQWLIEDRERAEQYGAALRLAAEHAALETVAIADDGRPEDAAATKLRIQARQWLAGRLARDRFGESTEVKHTGAVSLIAVLSGLPRGNVVDVTPVPALQNVPEKKSVEILKNEEMQPI